MMCMAALERRWAIFLRLFEMEIIYISSIVNNLCSTVTVLDRLLML